MVKLLDNERKVIKMAMEINIVNYPSEKFGIIRAAMIAGEPYFVGKDVAEALGYKNSRDALRKHVDDDDKQIIDISGNSSSVAKRDGTPREGNPNMVIINESGLYSLILSSKLPDAKKFKKWVTKEILPSLRKDGIYEDTEWNFLRAVGIEDRFDMTSSIKKFKKYCKKNYVDPAKYIPYGCRNLYSAFSCMINYLCDLPFKNDRNKLSKKKLKILSLFEDKVSKILIEDMFDEKEPDDIFIHVKRALYKRRRRLIKKGLLKDNMIIDFFYLPREENDEFKINDEDEGGNEQWY